MTTFLSQATKLLLPILLLPLLAFGGSPDDISVGIYTRSEIEELFLIEKGSLVIPDDGAAFDELARNHAFTPYAGVGMQVSRLVTIVGDPAIDPFATNTMTILHRHRSGKYYQEIFVDNEYGITGNFHSIVGYSGRNRYVGCGFFNTTEPPVPLIPTTQPQPCTLFLVTVIGGDTCSYNKGEERLGYIVELHPQIYTKWYAAFSNLDVFTAKDPNGNEWPQWVLENRDQFYDEGKTAPSCDKKMAKSSKAKCAKAKSAKE